MATSRKVCHTCAQHQRQGRRSPVYPCERCGMVRCAHFMKWSLTGYICGDLAACERRAASQSTQES